MDDNWNHLYSLGMTPEKLAEKFAVELINAEKVFLFYCSGIYG